MTAIAHPIHLVVYATLKRGQANHARFCANATDIVPAVTGAASAPWTSGSQPWMCRRSAFWRTGPTTRWPTRPLRGCEKTPSRGKIEK